MQTLRAQGAAVLTLIMSILSSAHGEDVSAYAGAPSFAHVALSPDGALVSHVEQEGTRQTVLLRATAAETEVETLAVSSEKERVRWCDWADSRYLLCGTVSPTLKQHRVYELTRLYAVDAVTKRVRELNTKLGPQRDVVIDLMPTLPERVMLQYDLSGAGYPGIYELNVATDALRRVERPRRPIRSWMSDGKGNLALGIGYEDGVASLYVQPPAGDWKAFSATALTDLETMGPLGFGPQASTLFVLKHHDGRAALFAADVSGRFPPRLLFAHAMYDVAGPIIVDPVTRELLAVRYLAEGPAQHFFSAREQSLQAAIDSRLPETVNAIIGRSLDSERLLVRSESDTDPPSLYFFELRPRRLTLLGHEYPSLEGRTHAPMRTVAYAARDGQRIPAFLTLPNQGPQVNLPAVVLPHGGPETRTWRAFDPIVQFLASQGLAVLQMNFRGSFGYGAGFAAAGAGQWGGIIHNDITDGTRWLVEEGIADPERICIVGESFGGYAALLGAAREAQWYSCAVSFAGISDLLALSQYAGQSSDRDVWEHRLGSDARALWQMSPLARIAAIETPVLLFHGRLDSAVPVSQSRRFSRALRRANKEHEFVERSDCDHEMRNESCREAFFAALRSFLRRRLSLQE